MKRYSGAWVLAHLEKKSGFLDTLSAAHSLHRSSQSVTMRCLIMPLLAWQGLCQAPDLCAYKSKDDTVFHATRGQIDLT